jgi:aldose sugar dehydrogenase
MTSGAVARAPFYMLEPNEAYSGHQGDFDMKNLANAVLLTALLSGAAYAQTNAGAGVSDMNPPFNMTPVTTFDFPWRLAFLPDGRMLVTEKVGRLDLVTQDGKKTTVGGTPPVYYQGQNGMLGVFLSPHFATDNMVYLTYVEPGEYGGGLALGRGTLNLGPARGGGPPGGRLQNFQVLWKQLPKGMGGQEGAQIAFAPDGNSLFLTVGDRQRFTPAQDINQPEGKILHMTLDGKPAPDNPYAGKTGATTISLIDPAADTEAAKTAPVVSTYTYTTPNLTPAYTWTQGHRTPYGLAFAPNGELWELEHGPKGGDDLNLIKKGGNYGWPLVRFAPNYDDVPVGDPKTRPDLIEPVIYWTPVIAPGNLMFYTGNKVFPSWNGNGLISGMATMTISRVVFDGHGGARIADRWGVGHRIRDIEEGPDGSLWALEDDNPGALFHITPK